VPKAEIVEEGYDLSLSRYKEDVFKEVEYEKPKDIFQTLTDLENIINNELKNLKNLL
jgi:type I restriction enzyme M protein